MDVEIRKKVHHFNLPGQAHAWLLKNDQPWLEKLTLVRKDGQRVFRFWQAGGGYDRNIDRQAALRQMIEYIHPERIGRQGCGVPLVKCLLV